MFIFGVGGKICERNLTFLFFKPCVPGVVPAGAFGELKICLFEFFKPFVAGVVPAGAFWELEICLFYFFKHFVRVSCPQACWGLKI